MDVFIDSDVVISSLISQSGAAYLLLNKSQITPVISTISLQELQRVTHRMGIEWNTLGELVKTSLTVITLDEAVKSIQKEYEPFVFDKFDAHIVAGAKKARVGYLTTYNLRHFNTDKIKADFAIRVMTPGTLLQYLRSL